MRAVAQRVRSARVEVDDEVVGRIDRGLVVFVGVGKEDAERDIQYLADKIVGLRVFEDDAGKMNRSVLDAGGSVLVVSQFTLYGDVRRGRRPSFDGAMRLDLAQPICERFVAVIRSRGVPVQTGRFQALMQVHIVNDGPVTILIDSNKQF